MKSLPVFLDRTQVSYLLALAQSARIRTGSPIALELVALLRAEFARRNLDEVRRDATA